MTNPTATSDDPDRFANGVARWLASTALAGCHFAAGFAHGRSPEGRLNYATFESAEIEGTRLEEINSFLDGCRSLQQAGILVFPTIRSVAELLSLAHALNVDRWRMRATTSMERGTLISLEWRAVCGKWSSAMGFAPLFSMPATRRAPYVAIALWPGDARENSRAPGLSFMDMPSHHEREVHDDLLEKTSLLSTSLLGEDPKKAPWRKATFCVDE